MENTAVVQAQSTEQTFQNLIFKKLEAFGPSISIPEISPLFKLKPAALYQQIRANTFPVRVQQRGGSSDLFIAFADLAKFLLDGEVQQSPNLKFREGRNQHGRHGNPNPAPAPADTVKRGRGRPTHASRKAGV
jgi:hypothetical protein